MLKLVSLNDPEGSYAHILALRETALLCQQDAILLHIRGNVGCQAIALLNPNLEGEVRAALLQHSVNLEKAPTETEGVYLATGTFRTVEQVLRSM